MLWSETKGIWRTSSQNNWKPKQQKNLWHGYQNVHQNKESIKTLKPENFTMNFTIFWFDIEHISFNYRERFLTRAIMQKLGFPHSSVGKESAWNAGEPGSLPGLGRFSGEGNSCPLQYSGLENSMDCIVHGVQRVRHDWGTFGHDRGTFTHLSILLIDV